MVKDFLSYLEIEAGLADNTIQAYGRDLRDFLRYCKASKINNLQQLQPVVIQQYLVKLGKVSTAEASMKRALVAIHIHPLAAELHRHYG